MLRSFDGANISTRGVGAQMLVRCGLFQKNWHARSAKLLYAIRV